jgi:four helix bundle protein
MPKFDHEKLIVYQAAIRFVVWSSSLLDTVPRRVSVHNQLERAATSIALNIAEGNGKHTSADRCRYFDTARASALECAACIDVLVAKKLIEVEPAEAGKELLAEIVSMMIGLIRANSGDRRV